MKGFRDLAYQVRYVPSEKEAITVMPFTGGMTREEVRLVSCPACGAGSTYKCVYGSTKDFSVKRPRARIHKARINKAREYRLEHRI